MKRVTVFTNASVAKRLHDSFVTCQQSALSDPFNFGSDWSAFSPGFGSWVERRAIDVL